MIPSISRGADHRGRRRRTYRRPANPGELDNLISSLPGPLFGLLGTLNGRHSLPPAAAAEEAAERAIAPGALNKECAPFPPGAAYAPRARRLMGAADVPARGRHGGGAEREPSASREPGRAASRSD